MIHTDKVAEIAAIYKKHGWILRRVLVSAKTRAGLKGTADLEGVKIIDSTIDAAWFSRPPKPEGTAWELRYLGDPPFALVETMDESLDDLEERLRGVEERLHDSIEAKSSA
jgi:hypothetical protein